MKYPGKSVLFVYLLLWTAFCWARPTRIIENIHIDQFGYRCDDQKIAVVSNTLKGYYGSAYTPGTAASQYQVRRWADDSVVFFGTLSAWNGGAIHAQSGDQVWWFDFSAVSTPGDYYIYDVATGCASYRFKINNQVYKEVLKQAMRSYFLSALWSRQGAALCTKGLDR